MRLVAAHCRGIPERLAQKFYGIVEKRISDEELPPGTLAKLGNSTAAFARADIETGRYEKGEPESTVNVNQQTGIRIEQPRGQEPTTFQKQMASMLASMLPPSVIDEHLPTGGNGQAEHDSNSSPIQEHPGT